MGRINTKRKGTRLEHKTMRVLEGLGYDCSRSAASRGTWDVVAIGAEDFRLVQVKANRRPGAEEMERIRTAVVPDNCTREIWVWKDRIKQPEIEVI